MAISADGHSWTGHGTIMQRGVEDALAATHPCLLITGRRWWLFYSGYHGANEGRHGAVLAAGSDPGAPRDRLGPLPRPTPPEPRATPPLGLPAGRKLCIFYLTP